MPEKGRNSHEMFRGKVKSLYSKKVCEISHGHIWDTPFIESMAPVEYVITILQAKEHAWVVKGKEKRKLVGVVTQKDFLKILNPERFFGYMGHYTIGSRKDFIKKHFVSIDYVKEIMNKHVVTCRENDDIKTVILLLTKYKLRRLPVINKKGILTGEVSIKDIMIEFSKNLDPTGLEKSKLPKECFICGDENDDCSCKKSINKVESFAGH